MYLALYRKYRPETFRDVISQEHITRTLKNQLKSGQFSHAYLFTGTRGTGKTTCAKILAKAVNCLNPIDGDPCLECENCKRIANGSTDVVEMDAASNNGVDEIRQLRDETVYTPIDVKYKVYIIDEVHMLSVSAFNALLKTLEEPPPHVIFILATTDVYKVPATILSRCQRFQFRKINPEESAQRLLEIAKKENALLTGDAAALLSRLADGAMRDALSLLDQCMAVGNNITIDTVRECCGAVGGEVMLSVSQAVLDNDPAAAVEIVGRLINESKDMTRFVDELTVFYRDLMLIKAVPGSTLVSALPEELKEYERHAGEYSLSRIMECLDVLSDSMDKINRLKQTSQLRILVEMLMIRLCASGTVKLTESKDIQLLTSAKRVKKPEPLKPEQVVSPSTNKSKPESATPAQTVSPLKNESKPEPATPAQTAPPPVNETKPKATIPAVAESLPEEYPLPPPPIEEDYPYDTEMPLPEPLEFTADEAVPTFPPAPEKKKKRPSPKPAVTEGNGPLPIKLFSKGELEKLSPVENWDSVIRALSPPLSGLLANSKAYYQEDIIVIPAGAAVKTALADGARSQTLRLKAEEILGEAHPLLLAEELQENKQEDPDKLEEFLRMAKELGIQVKKSNK